MQYDFNKIKQVKSINIAISLELEFKQMQHLTLPQYQSVICTTAIVKLIIFRTQLGTLE